MAKWILNTVTNQLENFFHGRLLSIGDTIVKNSNGTEYVIGTVQLPDNGPTRSARILYKNVEKMEIGVEYRVNVTKYIDSSGKEAFDMQVSPLIGADRATSADLAFLGDEVATEAPASGETVGSVEPVSKTQPAVEKQLEGVKQ